MRLGCGPGLYGRPGLRCFDGGRGAEEGELSVSLAYVRDGLLWCRQAGIQMLRLHWRALPRSAEAARRQLAGCQRELAHIGALARQAGVRLTIHAPLGLGLAGTDEALAEASVAHLTVLAGLLDGLAASDGVIVTHVGAAGGEGEAVAGRERWVARVVALPEAARRRVVVEHDWVSTVADVLELHQRCGAPVVFDLLHYQWRPGRLTLREALELCLATWPAGQTPKVHLSTPRTEARLRRRPGRVEASLPRREEHADLLNPFEALTFLRLAEGVRPFDVMLEARASDVALLRLRDDLGRLAPALARGLG